MVWICGGKLIVLYCKCSLNQNVFPNCQENEWKPGKVLKKHINLVFSPTIKDSNVRQVNIGGQSLVKIEHDWTWLDQNYIFQVL